MIPGVLIAIGLVLLLSRPSLSPDVTEAALATGMRKVA
jgi:hypothetical protein